MLNKPKQGAYYKWSQLIHETKSAQISQKQDEHKIYEIMKTTCCLAYYRNVYNWNWLEVTYDTIRHDTIYILFYIYIIKKIEIVLSWLLPICQRPHGNLWSWAQNVWELHISGTNEPKGV